MRSIVIHGHFYQPPRDDPWLGTIPREASAAPYHDWNERIERESYAPVAASLGSLSFDFGPTLLAWMERYAAETYAAVLAADRIGNAVAMPYHHTILPLSSRRDKETEVRWGIADFRRRFGREPEGMWLPETAVDDETLDVLAAEGIRFTILAPHQVERVRAGGRPGWHRTASGRRIALFLYDGALSHDVAFGPLVRDPAAWIERLTARDGPELVSIATDGETRRRARGHLRSVPRPPSTAGRRAVGGAERVELPPWSRALAVGLRLPRARGSCDAPALARPVAERARLVGGRAAPRVRAGGRCHLLRGPMDGSGRLWRRFGSAGRRRHALHRRAAATSRRSKRAGAGP